ncbi:uncharacterized protein NP_5360A [Natronomonas pharaonis DSM 2160]|uniref:Uncharacterized protein n=1 Tax=Natronomonas pharaonis (strain ATCC 35678 / DSM 2160 / CIP 103997 / JCM 8858 / NBRC 14720 / NCIMB 2260 / Gabara) TaxID=348780 RepID=A0A1U7EZP0_NATPD|nr:hypothetical protein [Natronomonas pharaonis]CAI50771.1 uncharacterized protein NP_5360A [Natronomonas pharaonis DSM 2160]
MLPSPVDATTAKRKLVDTYDNPSYEDPWDAVEDYEHVQRYTAAHPQQGSQAVSTATDLPRGRIRSWVDSDGMPDCYRGLQTALTNGWILDSWSDETARPMAMLAAWTLASGSINEHWTPTWVTDGDDEADALRHHADRANVVIEQAREAEDDRPAEWRPAESASVLGRVLYTWLGHRGDKNHAVPFPAFLESAPDQIRLDFARVHTQQRGIIRDDRPDRFVQIMAERSEGFRRALKELLQSVVGNPDDIRGDSWPLRIYGDAIDTLRQYPELD